MKTVGTTLLLLTLLCALCALASANSIAITGDAFKGYATSNGDFNIQGSGLNLYQGTPDGPSAIGSCNMGSSCNFGFTIGPTSVFCAYCLGLSGGSLGGTAVEFLDTSLTFKGSAVWNGQSNINVPLTISGMIIGYELINCQPGGISCSLGPEEFALSITAKGTGDFTMNEVGLIQGVYVTLSGTASTSPVPEPVSLVLTGSGLVVVFLSKKARARKSA
jgi:hypothetical protein